MGAFTDLVSAMCSCSGDSLPEPTFSVLNSRITFPQIFLFWGLNFIARHDFYFLPKSKILIESKVGAFQSWKFREQKIPKYREIFQLKVNENRFSEKMRFSIFIDFQLENFPIFWDFLLSKFPTLECSNF